MKSILVTGASGGIGRRICNVFYSHGWHVAGITKTSLKAKALEHDYPLGSWLVYDLLRMCVGVYNFPAFLGDRYDVVVNSAGIKVTGVAEEIELEDYQRVMNLNVCVPWLIMQAVIPRMVQHGGGKIINIASTVSYQACPFLAPYAASKHALVGLSHSIRDEMIANNKPVDICVISPGATDTPFNTPKDGQMDAMRVAEAVWFVANMPPNCLVDMMIYPRMEKRKP